MKDTGAGQSVDPSGNPTLRDLSRPRAYALVKVGLRDQSAFEGDGYRRVLAPVETSGGTVEAWIYVLAVPR